jgi:oligoendopeptidase F
MSEEEKVPKIYEEYLGLCRGVKYTDAAGAELAAPDLFAGVRSADPLVRSRAWELLCGAWNPHRPAFAALLSLASGEKNPDVQARFGLNPAPLLAAVSDIKDILHRALRRKAARIGADDFRFCDIWARVPNAGNTRAMPLAAALAVLGDMLEKHLEGGKAFVDEVSAGRLHLEEQAVDCPHCFTPVPGGPVHAYMPVRFKEVRPCDLPSLAHELGHVMHCDLLEKLAPGETISVVFLETFSQFLEGIVWLELCDGAEFRAMREDLLLDKLTEETLDLLLFPAMLEFEGHMIASSKKRPMPLEAVEKAYREILGKWFGASPEGTWFWMRSKTLYDPRWPFRDLTYLLGRLVSLELVQRIRTRGKMSRAEYRKAVEDTLSTDFSGYRLKQGRSSAIQPADWKNILQPVRDMFTATE